MKKLPPVEYLRECFAYDSRTGILIWKRRPIEHFATNSYCGRWNERYAGNPAGYINLRGYLVISIDKRLYYAHRIVFKLMTGEAPMGVDHADGNRVNNRWINLREATQRKQRWNSRPKENTVSGNRGVSLDRRRKKWRVRIKDNGVERFLGYFDNVKEAAGVYDAAARKLHGEFYKEPK